MEIKPAGAETSLRPWIHTTIYAIVLLPLMSLGLSLTAPQVKDLPGVPWLSRGDATFLKQEPPLATSTPNSPETGRREKPRTRWNPPLSTLLFGRQTTINPPPQVQHRGQDMFTAKALEWKRYYQAVLTEWMDFYFLDQDIARDIEVETTPSIKSNDQSSVEKEATKQLLSGIRQVFSGFAMLMEDVYREIPKLLLFRIWLAWYVTWTFIVPPWMKREIRISANTNNDHATAEDVHTLFGAYRRIRMFFRKSHEGFEKILRSEEEGEFCVSYNKFLFLYTVFVAIMNMKGGIKAKLAGEGKDLVYSVLGGMPVKKRDIQSLVEKVDFAILAYKPMEVKSKRTGLSPKDILKQKGYSLLFYEDNALPQRIAHYVAINHKQKKIVIALRGTAELSDVLTDLSGSPVMHECERNTKSGCGEMETVFVHEGFFTAANLLADTLWELLAYNLLPDGYTIDIVGHSLGAAVACVLGVILRCRIPQIDIEQEEHGKRVMHVWAYAPPPCLSWDAAHSSKAFITSVVWNHDVVPTMGWMNSVMTMKLLACLDSHLLPMILGSGSRFFQLVSVAKIWLGYKKVSDEEVQSVFDEFVMQVKDFLEHRQESNEPYLYVPGEVMLLWDRVETSGVPTGEILGLKTTGTHAAPLSVAFLYPDSFEDHRLAAYRDSLSALDTQMGEDMAKRIDGRLQLSRKSISKTFQSLRSLHSQTYL